MPGYEQIESLKNGGSWGKFWWKTCGFEWVKLSCVLFVSDKSQTPSVPTSCNRGSMRMTAPSRVLTMMLLPSVPTSCNRGSM